MKRGTLPSRAEAKFCDECGNKFAPPEAEGHSRSGSPCRELMIQGFTVGGDAQLRFHEDDWDSLRAAVTAACARANKVNWPLARNPIQFRAPDLVPEFYLAKFKSWVDFLPGRIKFCPAWIFAWPGGGRFL